jgi:lipooligosaccharide transport system permease protein
VRTSVRTPAEPGASAMRRLEPAAIGGVMSREVANFRTFWKATTFSSVLEPVIYLLAFGLGLGATIVDRVDGLEYVQFVGTGMVATAVIFSSAFPAMFGTFVKERFQRTYDAILAAPVDVEELVTAEMLWISLRAGFYGCFPLVVAMLFGLDPAWGMLLVPFFCFITALAFAAFGIAVAASVPKIDSFNYVTTLVITPLFLVAGTFFPIDQLPEGFQAAAQVNPLHHLVELVRGAAFGFEWTALIRVAVLIAFAVALWRLAVSRMTKRLID